MRFGGGKAGFAEQVRTGVHLVVGQSATVDLELRVGEASQQVTVNADALLVDVNTANVAGLVGEQEIKALPLNGRSYDELSLTLKSWSGQFHLGKNRRDWRVEFHCRK